MKTLTALLSAAAALIGPSAIFAHHSYAMFDLTHQATLHGTVNALEWTNPHVWLWITPEGEPGTTPYGFETLSPGELTRFCGFRKNSVAVGERITVTYAPLRSGKHGGAIKSIKLPDGRVLQLAKTPVPPPPGVAQGVSP
jgi:hypothetical protein